MRTLRRVAEPVLALGVLVGACGGTSKEGPAGGGRVSSMQAGVAGSAPTATGGTSGSAAMVTSGTGGVVANGGSGGIVANGGSGGIVANGGSGGVVANGGSGGVVANGGSGAAASPGGSAGIGTGGSDVACAAAGRDPSQRRFVHPGGLHKRSDLERMRAQVAAGIEPWKTSYANLQKDARASYDYAVLGSPSFAVVARDGDNASAFEADATAAYLNALAWNVSGDERHARKAVQIFNAWKNLTQVTGGGTEALNAGLYAWKLLEAAELIKTTSSVWSAEDIAAFSAMLVYPGYSNTAVPATLSSTVGTFYWRIYQGDPGRHGNQDLIAWRALLILGVFLDNEVIYDRALRYFKGEPHRADDLPYPAGPALPGAQLQDNAYFTSYQPNVQTSVPDYGYNGVLEHYIWENGQCQESSRDQQHALFGLGIAAGIAEVAWNQGDGAWNALDQRLLKGFEFTARYNASQIATFADQATPWEPSGSEVSMRVDRTGRWRSKAINPYFESDFVTLSRGDFPGKRPVFEQALAHFGVRMGLPATATLWTSRARDVAIEKSSFENNGFSLDHPGWGGLTFRRPAGCAGDPIRGFVQGVPDFALPVLPATLEAEHYDYFPIRGEGHTYHDLSPGKVGVSYRDDDVDIVCGPDGHHAIGALERGEFVTYTVSVPTAGAYSISVRYRALVSPGEISVDFAGVDATGTVSLPVTTPTWVTQVVADRVALTAGVQALRVHFGAAFELDALTIQRAP